MTDYCPEVYKCRKESLCWVPVKQTKNKRLYKNKKWRFFWPLLDIGQGSYVYFDLICMNERKGFNMAKKKNLIWCR